MLRGLPFLAVASLFFLPVPAQAARPCEPVKVADGEMAKVATVRVGCAEGREVAADYYARLAKGEHWDGKVRGSIYYKVGPFRCFTGLGGTQAMCRHHDRWVFASVRPEDHPDTWQPPATGARHRRKLGTVIAARLMRTALNRRFDSYAAGYARRVKCNKRVSFNRVRCEMSWIVGDIVFFGKGQIWLTYPRHIAYWNYAWRITEFNEYCAIVEHGPRSRCVHDHTSAGHRGGRVPSA